MLTKTFPKAIITLICLVMVALGLLVFHPTEADAATYSGYCGTNGTNGANVTWNLDTDTGVLNITGSGAMKNYASYDSSSPPWYSHRSYIKTVNIGDSVTSIGAYAFSGCSSLTSVVIPDSVTSIDSRAFSGCSSLTSVVIPYSVTSIGNYAFNGCDNLTSVTIPDSITSIGNYAFNDCDNLTSVVIGKNVTSIGNYAFYNCSKLALVINCSKFNITKRGSDYGYVGYYAKYVFKAQNAIFDDNIIFFTSSSVNYLYDCNNNAVFYTDNGVNYLYYYNSSDTIINLPDSCNGEAYEIAPKAFYNYENIISVTIPDGVTGIGDSAFSGSSLASVVIPDSVVTIGDYAFSRCNLTSVVIPDSVVTIGNGVFSYCKSLITLNIPDSVTTIGEKVFYDTGYYNSSTTWEDNCLYIDNCLIEVKSSYNGNFTIKSGTRLVASYAFNGCSNLTGITIPESITHIGDYAFSGTGLTNITIPDSVTTIGMCTFEECYNLTEITLGLGITTIEESAFESCVNLTTINIPNNVTSIGANAFASCEKLTSVNITDIGKWCEITFADAMANPLYYAGKLYVNREILTELAIPDGAEKIGNYAFYNYQHLISVTIPDSVTTIGESAFYNCRGLSSVTIGKNVQTISANAFYSCSGLKTVTISDSVTTIGESAFYSCWGLSSVTIGKNVQTINANAFYSCSGLKTVIFKSPCGWSAGNSRYFLYTELSDVYFSARYLRSDYNSNNWTRSGHEYAVETVAPTCTTNGYTTYVCPDCAYTRTDNIIPALGHSEYETTIIQPTCIGGGCTVYTCITCGNGYIGDVTDALGHTEVTDAAVAPTCTEIGYTEGKHCSVCETVTVAQNEVPVIEHNYGSVITAPTCTTEGFTTFTCADCGDTYKDNTVAALGHDYENTVISATCTEKGYTFHICATCEHTYISAVTEPLGHTEITDKAVTPTCTEAGLTEGKHCSVCNEIFTQQTAIAPIGHTDSDDNGFCDSCDLNLGKRLSDGAIIGIAVAGAAVLCGAQFVITMAINKKKFMRA